MEPEIFRGHYTPAQIPRTARLFLHPSESIVSFFLLACLPVCLLALLSHHDVDVAKPVSSDGTLGVMDRRNVLAGDDLLEDRLARARRCAELDLSIRVNVTIQSVTLSLLCTCCML